MNIVETTMAQVHKICNQYLNRNLNHTRHEVHDLMCRLVTCVRKMNDESCFIPEHTFDGGNNPGRAEITERHCNTMRSDVAIDLSTGKVIKDRHGYNSNLYVTRVGNMVYLNKDRRIRKRDRRDSLTPESIRTQSKSC